MLDSLKNHKSSKGNTVGYELKKKYPNGQWIVEDDQYIYQAIVSNTIVMVKWKKSEDGFVAVNGRAIDLTPDLHDVTQKLVEKRKEISVENLKIFDYVSNHFEMHGDEELSFIDASKEFGLDIKSIKVIYYRVDELLYRK